MTKENQPDLAVTAQPENIATAKVRKTRRISPFWLLPIIALIIGATLFFQIIKEQGETVHITFANGDGLVANKTQIRYQGLQIGLVKKVNFTDDLKLVKVEASIYPEAKTVLRENTKFWLVQPNASLAGISGLDTLISGNYITLQPGDGDYKYDFVAESGSQIVQLAEGDLLIHLLSDDLGSISQGASIFYKKMPVGKVLDYRFTPDQKQVEINVAIEKDYAHLIKKDSRFWNISGIRANMDLSGINLNIDSLQAVVRGAITFDSPEKSDVAENEQQYTLYPDLSSAQRGIEVNVTLPAENNFQAGKTEVFYQDMQVGTLTYMEEAGLDNNVRKGKLLLAPNMNDILRKNTKIVVRSPKVDLTKLDKLPELLRGQYLDIIAGDGEPTTDFTILNEKELLLTQANALQLTLTAPETYGIRQGQEVYYNNISIGRLVEQQIDTDGVIFKAVIFPEYRGLIHADTQFIAASNFDIAVGVDGLRMQAPAAGNWLQGGIQVVNQLKQGHAKTQYPLYKDQEHADMGVTDSTLKPALTLKSTQLPNISKGSLVLYRQYEVGKILDVRPLKDHFDVDVAIYPKFAHLLTNNSLFWVESPAQIDITPKGISIQASPIARSLKGAISFDNSGGGKNHTLYANELVAKSAGQVITLTAEDATNLSKGMSLRYMGLTVGEIDSIQLDKNNNKIIAKALMNPNYMGIVAKTGSVFKVISPEISASGVENLDSLLQPYIDIEVGSGAVKKQFVLYDKNTPQNNKFLKGVPFILETTDASNVTQGSPVMYRGVDVGKIRHLELNSLGDRVLIHIIIDPKYAHLVRTNSQFWLSSGYTAGLGWSGIEVNTGTVQQLLKGGISFSTPSGTVVQPQAKANQRFLLQIRRPDESKQWNSGTMAE
ncbi:MlaD family protein [Lonepinella sp. BR2474]|uniref:PqiB family protein n=1 Tax=Lonepinella sp. BR2474 TaxID=3434548 RepID=UPI003F6E2F7B